MNELEIAYAIAENSLPSPQQVGNFWLFAVRITGTGYAFRKEHQQYVYRNPDNYLNDDFIARCAALPVLWNHADTDSEMLDSQAYNNQVIGSIMFAYINGDEVWGIARINNGYAAQDMARKKLSTSPALTSLTQKLDEKNNVLYEGKPHHLDHLAICLEGVWDKQTDKLGINTNEPVNLQEEVQTMDEETLPTVKTADEAVAQQEQEPLAKVLQMLQGIDARLQKLEGMEQQEQQAAAAPVAADTAEDLNMNQQVAPDAEMQAPAPDLPAAPSPQVEGKPAADSNAAMARKLADMERRLTPLTVDDYNQLAAAVAKRKELGALFADSAHECDPLTGERPLAYRVRQAKKLQSRCADVTLKSVAIDKISDPPAFAVIEGQIYADAAKAANNRKFGAGEFQRRDTERYGIHQTEFVGDTGWMNEFKISPMVGRVGVNLNA